MAVHTGWKEVSRSSITTEWRSRLGESEEIPVTRGNTRILKAFYFPDADATIIINTFKDEVSIWRFGRQGY